MLAGNDEAHPYPISEELSKLLPDCEFLKEWKIRELVKKGAMTADALVGWGNNAFGQLGAADRKPLHPIVLLKSI